MSLLIKVKIKDSRPTIYNISDEDDSESPNKDDSEAEMEVETVKVEQQKATVSGKKKKKKRKRVCHRYRSINRGHKGYKTFPCSHAQLSTKFILLINVKMPTIVGIFNIY